MEHEAIRNAVGRVRKVVMVTKTMCKLLDVAKVLALVLLAIYLPALVIISLVIIFSSPGPAFIQRCYRRANGQTVDLWEFRTECWSRWQPTPVGQYLRRSNMYRLPALVNILRGDIGIGERVKAAQEW